MKNVKSSSTLKRIVLKNRNIDNMSIENKHKHDVYISNTNIESKTNKKNQRNQKMNDKNTKVKN